MSVRFCEHLLGLVRLARAFRTDEGGQIVMLFAAASVGIFAALGAAVDLASAYSARQRLSEVATLACQYSTRPSVGQTSASNYSGTNGFGNYVAAVNAFATASLTAQRWSNAAPTGASGTAGSYFTATQAAGGSTGSAAAAAPTNPVVEMSAAIPTSFARVLNINSITVHAKVNCQTLANTPQVVNPPNLIKEGFETPCSGGYCVYNPSGGTTEISTPTSSFPANASYVGYGGFSWYVVGYCLEIDPVGVISSTVPEGTHTAELDCGNGSYSAGNSSISTKLYLAPGQYELRYNFRSRVDYPNYNPAYICGSTAADVAWATDNASSGGPVANVVRTNQINVYLDRNLDGTNGTTGSAPLHTTLDGTQSLAGSNLIDMCVHSISWVERSVRVKVTTPGYYWLSFAADGANESFGGQIDNIRFCQQLCSGSLQDNFPSSWLAVNNGSVNKILFQDNFGSPSHSSSTAPYTYTAGNLNASYGTTSASACGQSYASPPGWPCQASRGWATAPYNQATYVVNGAYTGTTQYIELDGVNASGTDSASSTNTNRLISRPFLLDPGYYQVTYNYLSMASFGAVGTYCTYAPGGGFIYGTQASANAAIRYAGNIYTDGSTNIVGVFMANGALVSTPIVGGAQGSRTSYTNPDGTVSSTPTVAPDAVYFPNYNASQPNPLIDVCGYAQSYTWVPRAVSVKIRKPGFYWLTFSTNGGTADGVGGTVDDVRLTALGSPFMSTPPSAPLVTIPVPAPQPDTSYEPGSYAGYTIVADPFTPPGADQ